MLISLGTTNKKKDTRNLNYHHHHHLTQCISLTEKLWTGSGEGRTATTHTHKEEHSQRSPPTREK